MVGEAERVFPGILRSPLCSCYLLRTEVGKAWSEFQHRVRSTAVICKGLSLSRKAGALLRLPIFLVASDIFSGFSPASLGDHTMGKPVGQAAAR